MITSLTDQLEPYWEDLDGLIKEGIKSVVRPMHYRYFTACSLKLKALWYIQSRVGDLDLKYGQLVDSLLKQGTFDRFSKNSDRTWSYLPFFEALEFENLLNQGKACLDCFSKAVGSTFGELPNNISKLERVIKSDGSKKHGRSAQASKLLLHNIVVARTNLDGILLDPGNSKKSIRDLVSHREFVSIHFRIAQSHRSATALVRSDHPEIVRLSDYRVTEISERVWYHTRKLVAESLPLLL